MLGENINDTKGLFLNTRTKHILVEKNKVWRQNARYHILETQPAAV